MKKSYPQKGKKVLLFGAGMDSVAIKHLLKPDVLLYFRIGSMFESAELEAIQRLGYDVTFDDSFNFREWEEANGQIPARNLFFVAGAAWYGDEIYLGATSGDRPKDKDDGFATIASILLTHIYTPPYHEDRSVRVSVPFRDYTKTKLVEKFLSSGGNVDELKLSMSCFYPKGEGIGHLLHCGNCRSCARRWTAFVNNGIDVSNDFILNPKDHWLDDRGKLKLIAQGKYYGAEDRDVMRSLGLEPKDVLDKDMEKISSETSV